MHTYTSVYTYIYIYIYIYIYLGATTCLTLLVQRRCSSNVADNVATTMALHTTSHP